jgi:hypothetical protein
MALLAPYRGPAFQEGRYSIHLLPLAFVLLSVVAGAAGSVWAEGGLRKMLGAAPPAARSRVWGRAAVVAYLAVAVVTLVPAATRYGWAVQNINAMDVHLGRWVGLVTPQIIPYRRQGEAGVLRYVLETCPDHVIIFPAWFPGLAARADLLQPVYRVRLERNEVAGSDEMVVYRLARCTV